MAYLHELRFCHRDLKAANILLARDGTAKIGDFGLTSWSKWPSWQGHIGPPRSPQTAFGGLRRLYALGWRGLAAQTTAGSDGSSARGRPS